MSFNRIVVAALVAAACIGGALACGPFFPWQLLDNRDRTVAEPVGLGFALEATRLVVAPNDRLKLVERADPTSEPDASRVEARVVEQEEAASSAWRALIPGPGDASKTFEAKVAAARSAIDGEAALAAGAGLPVAVATYIAGAIEFRADRYDAALRYFAAIDRLPPDQRRIRAVVAAYMRGRVYQRLGDMALARAAFQEARRYALARAPDPMGLAVASLGEEARSDLAEAGLVTVPWPVTAAQADDPKTAGLIADAVRLYAEQAARGSKMALLSLREVSALLVAHERELKLAVADPLVRRLLVAYVVARDGQSVFEEAVADAKDPVVVAVGEAVLAQPAPAAGPDLDRLAALAYQAGRYEMAEKLTATTDRALGLWVRAKLALRRGDRTAAARAWIAALNAIETDDAAAELDAPARTRLRGEAAVVKLSQGDYRDSLRLLFPVASTYWGDVAYIAERVLTVNELKGFVDDLPPTRVTKPNENEGFFIGPPGERLRELLARRLVRVGRIGEAIAYFPAPRKDSTPDQPNSDQATAADARGYLAAVEAARPAWSFDWPFDGSFDWPWQRVARAEALFKVAAIARQKGMELMGTEGPPDEAATGGNFPAGFGQSSPDGLSSTPSALLGPDEAKRFAASAAKPDVRFHYRTIAADHALAAADLLPQRTQAYAAALCWATRYAFASSDEKRAAAIYRQYVSTGVYQPWANRFGSVCPDPDFESARTFWSRRIEAWPAQIAASAGRHLTLVAVVAVVLLGAAVWLARAWRRRPG